MGKQSIPAKEFHQKTFREWSQLVFGGSNLVLRVFHLPTKSPQEQGRSESLGTSLQAISRKLG